MNHPGQYADSSAQTQQSTETCKLIDGTEPGIHELAKCAIACPLA